MTQPLAYIHPDAKIAPNVVIEPFVTIERNVEIGAGCVIKNTKIASGTKVQLKMWLFPWLTYAVIFVIVASLITMVVEGTFFNEVVYTSIFGGILVVLGLMAQKYNWGGEQRAQAEKERLEIQAQLQKNKEA